jgi:hypothetical protein
MALQQGQVLAQSKQQLLEQRQKMKIDKRNANMASRLVATLPSRVAQRGECDFSLDSVHATNNPLAQIIQSLVGSGISITNIQTNLPASSSIYGKFSCGSGAKLGLESGLVLTTGSILNVKGPNAATSTSGSNYPMPGYSLLDGLANGTGYDAAWISFDIVSNTDSIKFDYVFASEEYKEFVGSEFNDVFGFFISGPGITGTQNLAVLPNSTTPVTINSINHLENPGYYIDNDYEEYLINNGQIPASLDATRFNNLEYDGLTTVLTARAHVSPGQTYHMILAIEDVSDDIYDAGVFIKGGSVTSGTCNMTLSATHVDAGCATATDGSINLSIANGKAPYDIKWSNNATTEDLNNLAPGTYTVTVTDASPCQKKLSVTVLAGTAAVAPSVTIAANPGNTICNGTSVSFTATPTNGGNTPSYQWKLNGANVGTNSNTYQNAALANGSKVTCVMTSSLACANPATATSNEITMTVTAAVAPSVTIAANPGNSICNGTSVTFTATPTNGGTTPTYQWKLNGANVGTNSNTYQNAALANGSKVTCVMTSSLACANPATATSNEITMTVTAAVAPSVTIAANPGNTICNGTSVTFTATPTNGGTTPTYQWKLNGANVGTNSNTYQNAALANGSKVTCVMTSSLACANPATATSNEITMAVNNLLTFYRDLDGDGYGNTNSGPTQACVAPVGYVRSGTDCNDNNSSVKPGATEICDNGIDDNCNGLVDEGCTSSGGALPRIFISTYLVTEGNSDKTLNLKIFVSKPSKLPISFRYATENGSAIAGKDYKHTEGLLQIAAGSQVATLPITIIGDKQSEQVELFYLRFSNAVNAWIPGSKKSRLFIIDDDRRLFTFHPFHPHGEKAAGTSAAEKIDPGPDIRIPTLLPRQQALVIQGLAGLESNLMIIDARGLAVAYLPRYSNNWSPGNLASGIYFYQLTYRNKKGEPRVKTGKIFVTD